MNESSSLLSSRKRHPKDGGKKYINEKSNTTNDSDQPSHWAHNSNDLVQHDYLYDFPTDHSIEATWNPYNQPQVDLLISDNELLTARSAPLANDLKYHPPIPGNNLNQLDSSISSSMRKLLARQTWRTSKSSPIASGITGPILMSFDEEEDDHGTADETKVENRPLLDLDGIHTNSSNLQPLSKTSSIDFLGFMKKDEVENLHRSNAASPFVKKVQSLSNRFGLTNSLNLTRPDIPDPARAISNLFGLQVNPLTAPNLLDKITEDDGVELLSTPNHHPVDRVHRIQLDEPEEKLEFIQSSSITDISHPVYISNTSQQSKPMQRSYTHKSHEIHRNNVRHHSEPNIFQHDEPVTLMPPYESHLGFTKRNIPLIINKNNPNESAHDSFQNINIGGCTSNHSLQADEVSSWSRLSILLSISYGCTSFAGSTAIALVPSIASQIFQPSSDESSVVDILASNFVSIVASNAVFSSALGKFINGPLGDIFGARRVSCIYSILLSLSLFLLSFSNSEKPVLFYCLAIEFTQSVQWPCIAIILTAHFGESSHSSNATTNNSSKSNHLYERSVYEVSISSRIGQLLASFTTTLLLHYYKFSWIIVCRLASQISFLSCIVVFLFVDDSPTKRHHPQNPIRDFNSGSLGSFIFKSPSSYLRAIEWIIRVFSVVLFRNIFPSVRSVLRSGTFWIVAIGHSGGSIILTSSRILGSYFKDTSYGTVSVDQAGEFTAFLSLGIFVGLYVGGKNFSIVSSDGRGRKRLIQRNYTISVGMCYVLALLAVPMIRSLIYFPSLVTLFQIISTFFMGAGVAVQLYCIPAIVGATFGANKGLYFSYTDGVAYLVGSMVWGLVAGAVAEGNPQGSGWAYGWAAVALLVILAGWLMVEFVGRYFAQGEGKFRLQSSSSSSEPLFIDPIESQEKLRTANVEKMEKCPLTNQLLSPIITL